MRLRIITPLVVVVDEDINSLSAEDDSGRFGILGRHAPFLTALAVSIVSWRTTDAERFCALRGGVMTVGKASTIDIATREAVTGDDLATLDSDVLAQFRSDADDERTQHVEAMRLQFNAIRHMVSRLNAGANAGEFR
ncbi:F-type H+-transporting ATPase subunit epsilon [Yoonia maritima]|uniref:ATP synthase epsilon chain n=1 Tax=Yoonia maritima TaxID=1435347 RepID=A0A2T0W4Y0_9RHOB|nr:F0F1 ATP synthase subunit epsilon [Yoonia maritima]PRY80539.1 F-type H+-transporting ATPase subunit epsilon [Yoonia maritima]